MSVSGDSTKLGGTKRGRACLSAVRAFYDRLVAGGKAGKVTRVAAHGNC